MRGNKDGNRFRNRRFPKVSIGNLSKKAFHRHLGSVYLVRAYISLMIKAEMICESDPYLVRRQVSEASIADCIILIDTPPNY